jgi:hypothetical protein
VANLSPAERKRIAYDIESLHKAIKCERNILNRTTDPEVSAYCAMVIAQLFAEINRLNRRIPKPKRVGEARSA